MNDGQQTARARIYGALSERIGGDELLPNTPLPSLRQLGRQFKTSVGPVRQALDALRSEGRVYSEHGRGNFVSALPAKSKNVMLITRLQGHLYSECVLEFSRLFSGHATSQLICEEMPCDTDHAAVDRLFGKIDAAINRKQLDALIFSDPPVLIAQRLATYEDRLGLYCFLTLPEEDPFVACRTVVTDPRHGGVIGIRHLHQAGCRHVLVITHRTEIYGPGSVVRQFLDGCGCEAAERGITLVRLEHQAEATDYKSALADVLAANPGIDGVYALGDFRLTALYPILRDLGRRVGEDIAVLGYYDTPLTTAFHPELSSVSLSQRELVERICALYFDPTCPKGTRQVLLPRVVPRASSALLAPGPP